MSSAIKQDLSLDFSSLTEECHMCNDGKSYSYIETCRTCKGKKRFLKGTRHYKCKTCQGNGYTSLAEPVYKGLCGHCDGTKRVPMNKYSQVTKEDKQWIFENLFNFEKPYTAVTSSFNENYLGMGIICGVTDYGRHKDFTPEEFKQEVYSRFTEGWLQYITLAPKDHLPSEILIKRSRDGWYAYPIYNQAEKS